MYFGDDNKGILKNFVEMIINNGVLKIYTNIFTAVSERK
jgi:F0F1-type ATP synthase delta subunit